MFRSFKCYYVAQKRACVNYSNYRDGALGFVVYTVMGDGVCVLFV